MKHSWSRLTLYLLLPAGIVLLAGCSLMRAPYEPRPKAAAPKPLPPETLVAYAQPERTDGSIWPDDSYGWFVDDKAYRAGDIVLVSVVQRNTGSKNANTDTSRESKISATIKYMLGLEEDINEIGDYDENLGAGASSPHPQVEATSSNEFKGEGETARSDTLTATVSAMVTQVLPNGNLVIYGHQTVTLNNEASVLTVQGIVKPSDISAENIVDSSRIANADIQFTGSGVITDKQHPGWGMRIFDWVWPF